MFHNKMFLTFLFINSFIFSAENGSNMLPLIMISSPEETVKKPKINSLSHLHILACPPIGSTKRIVERGKLLIDIEVDACGIQKSKLLPSIEQKKETELNLLICTLYSIGLSGLVKKVNTIAVRKISSFSAKDLEHCFARINNDKHIKNLIRDRCRIVVVENGSIEIRKYAQNNTFTTLKSYPNVIKVMEGKEILAASTVSHQISSLPRYCNSMYNFEDDEMADEADMMIDDRW